MVTVELTDAELKLIYNQVNGSFRYAKRFFNPAKMNNPEAARNYLELVEHLRDKLRPIKTALWRKAQGKE